MNDRLKKRVPKKKNILLVVRWPVGGIRTFLRYIYGGFGATRWRFTLIAPKLEEIKILLEEDLSGLDINYIPVETNPSFLAFANHIFLELMRNRYELVHSHGFTSGACTAVPARFFGIRHIMTSHDVINENQFDGYEGRVKKRCLEFLFGLADLIHSVSYDAQANLHKFFPTLSRKKENSIVIPNGIEVERFVNAEARELKAELGLADDVFLIGFLGRFMSQKGFRYLIDAIELLKDRNDLPQKPIVLTFGDGGFAERERRSIRARKLDGYFIHMPFASNVAGAIKGLDVVAMPSLWEACGLLAMETLVCGTPLIASDCIGLREVVSNTPAMVVKSADAYGIANMLAKEILSSSKIRFQNFCSIAEKRFDVRKAVQDFLCLYESNTFAGFSKY